MGVPSCNVLVPGNSLFGTSGADQVRISKADGADGLAGKYKVGINGQTRVMDKAELEATRFELGAGDDAMYIDPAVKAKIQLNGGTGTTRIEGNSRNVVDASGPDKAALPKPFRIPGTPLIVIPLEAARKGESLSLIARRAAEARFAEDAEKSEAGAFRPDLLPAQVMGSGQPSTEGFIGVRVKKNF